MSDQPTTKSRGALLGCTATAKTMHIVTTSGRRALCSARIEIVRMWWSDFLYDPDSDPPMCWKCQRQVLAAAIVVLQESGGHALALQVRDAFRRSYPEDAQPPVTLLAGGF
jgi:hypothetical protein